MSKSTDLTIENLKKVLAVNSQINSTLELGALLEVIMNTATEVMNSEVASLLLVDEANQELVFQVALGEKGEDLKEKFRVKIGEGIAGTVAETGKSLIVNDAQNDSRVAKRFDDSTGFVTKSILCVPMKVENRIIGVLQAINPKDEHDFSSDDQFLFENFADQAAIAVENARMHGEILKQARVKQDLKIAHQIQQNFLPDFSQSKLCISVDAKNIPALEVGGDFYDVVKLGSNKAGVIIGDVSGKGTPAALYMVRAISEFRFLSHQLASPSQLLFELNRILSKNSTMGMFVTLVYMVFDLEKKTMVFASGGHHAILKRSAQTGAVEELENSGGPPIGLVEGSTYEENEIPLNSNDIFFAYTDGLVEARNKNKEEYGLARTEGCLSEDKKEPRLYAEAVLDDVKKFSAGTPVHDDLTVIVTKIP